VRARFDASGVDALVVTERANVRWLTGFTGSHGWAVLAPDGLVLVTDGRYTEQARAELAGAGADGTVVEARSLPELRERVAELTAGLRRVGIEAEHLSVAEHGRLRASLTAELVPTSGLVEAERRTKDPAEIARIVEACRIADAALAAVAPLLAGRPREVDVRDELDHRMRRLGAEGPSYDTIVAAGPLNAARPHHRPDRTVVEEGQTVVIDVGALVDGYHSDMTRTFVVGDPSPTQRAVFEVVAAAQRAGVAAVRSGLRLADLDATCRGSITAAGWGEWFTHGTGHGVGLVIHEDPFVNRTASGELRAGDVVTVEPGVYREDFGGVRIEDLVLVTDTGCRVLTTTPKDSPCLPSPPTT
jgi:Xaa-Pro aminopeptidase